MKKDPIFILNLLENTDDLKKRANREAKVSEEDIANVLNILEDFGHSDMGRLKISTDTNKQDGTVKKQQHHGRCDVGYKLDLKDKKEGTC